MLIQPLLEKLSALRLPGIRQGLEEQSLSTQYAELTFEERLGMLVDKEWQRRENVKLSRGLRLAKFHQAACIEDLDIEPMRGLDRKFVLELAQSDWVRTHLNLIVIGKTGAGKTYLACTLGQAACRVGLSVRYLRTSRIIEDFDHAHADGSYPKMLDSLAKVNLLVIDDWLRDPLSPVQARNFLEILDDRYGKQSTLVTSQLSVADWHQQIQDPTIADAILDRLVHNAYRIELQGDDSQRKKRSPIAQADHLTV
jgi:DNA replication protein DnaC